MNVGEFEKLIYFFDDTPYIDSLQFANHFKISHKKIAEIIHLLNSPQNFLMVEYRLLNGTIEKTYHCTLEGINLLHYKILALKLQLA